MFGRSRKTSAKSNRVLQETTWDFTERMLSAAKDEAEQAGLWAPTFSASWFGDGTPSTRLDLAKDVLSDLRRDLQVESDWSVVENTEQGLRMRWWGGPVPLDISASFERDTVFGPAVAVDARLDPFEVSDPQVGAFMAMQLNHERATSYGWVYNPRTQRLFARAGAVMVRLPAQVVGGTVSPKRLRQSIHELYGIGSVTIGAILADFMEGQPQWATLRADVHPSRQELRTDMPPFLHQLGAQLHRMGEEGSMTWGPRPVRDLFGRFRAALDLEQQRRFEAGEEFLTSIGHDATRELSVLRVPYPGYEPATVLFVGNESQPYLGPGLVLAHETAYRVEDSSAPYLISALTEEEAAGGSGTSSLGWWYTAPSGSFSGFPAQQGEQLLGFATFIPQGRSLDVDPAEVVGEHVRRGWWLRSVLGVPQAPPAPALSYSSAR